MEPLQVAKVAVDRTVFSYDRTFDYRIPQSLRAQARAGCRVLVPFGGGNRKRLGVILSVADGTTFEQLKPISAVLDKAPLLHDEMLELAYWLKERTFCTLFDAFKVLLPAGINLKLESSYSVPADLKENETLALDENERRVLQYLVSRKVPVERGRLLQAMGLTPESDLPETLANRGLLVRSEDATRRVGDAKVKMVRLTQTEAETEPPPKLTERQQKVIRLLQETGSASLKEISYFTGVTQAVVSTLEKKGLVEYFDNEVYRNPYGNTVGSGSLDTINLTDGQQRAYDRLLNQYQEGKGGVSLLYGVTGSGKTSVFMRLIDAVQAQGKSIIVMVPEISLTPQTISLFHARYGRRVAVFHSGLSIGERLDEWKRVKNGDADIVVGTRSAVFAPFQNLGLVIMDEEQEYTYKSESSPRYHARDVAKFRCAYNKGLLVLCSATPSMESYYSALNGRYSLNTLNTRYGEATLPEVVVADMNEDMMQGNTSVFSSVLAQALEENLQSGRQSILLLNRRGYNTFVSCRACRHVLTCPSCSISLTYHAANNRLMCHYCGYSAPFTQECPQCHESKMRYSGSGTQRAEQELELLFPKARILRMDTDTTMSRFSYEKKLKLFSEGEYDIMVGTQMIAKGLDFENVTLVGVLSADQTLYGDDFRSFERAFALLTQVVGRSGRGKYPGKAIVQTFTPENPVIQMAAAQDYERFYKSEIGLRKAMLYPPFAELCVVGFTGPQEPKTAQAAEYFMRSLKELAVTEYSSLPMRVLGPNAAAIAKVSNKYRYKILIKCRNDKKFREMMAKLLVQYGNKREYSDVAAYADMNPESIL